SVDGKGKRLARHSWSRRSTRWSADDSSKNSRCSGRCAGPLFCCRPGRGSSTRIWTTYSAVGIQNWGELKKRNFMHAKSKSPSGTAHVIEATIGPYGKSFLRAFTREKRYLRCVNFPFLSSPQ